MTKTAEALPMALAQIDDWEAMGLLDAHWAKAFKMALRRPGDDKYDPDYRTGMAFADQAIDHRGDLFLLLDLIHEEALRFDDDEREVVLDIIERIGWEPS